MRWTRRWVFILCCLCGGAAGTWPSGVLAGQDLTHRYDDLMEVHERTRGLATAQRATAIAGAFDRNFADYAATDLSKVADQELITLFRAANIAHAYSVRGSYLEVMRRTFDALDARGLVSQGIYGDMHAAMFASREFSQARRLEAKFPQWPVESVPDLSSDTDAAVTVLSIPDTGTTLRRVELDVGNGPRVIVISHPLCHFSRGAIAAVEADEDLSKIMVGSTWLAPVDRTLYLDVLRQWNRDHAQHPVVLAFDRAEWPSFDSWSTPTFYFLKDGKVVSVVEGWPGEGNKQKVIQAARRIGL